MIFIIKLRDGSGEVWGGHAPSQRATSARLDSLLKNFRTAKKEDLFCRL